MSDPLDLISKARLVKKLEEAGVANPKKQATDVLKDYEVNQIRKPVKVNRDRYFKIVGQIGSYLADIAFLPQYRVENGGKTAFLLLVEVPTRLAYALPLKNSTGAAISKALQTLASKVKNPIISLTGDDQFNQQKIQEFLKEKKIELYTGIAKDEHITKFGDRLGIVDSAVKNIKTLISKYIYHTERLDWTSYLPSIMHVYNNSRH